LNITVMQGTLQRLLYIIIRNSNNVAIDGKGFFERSWEGL